MGEHGVLQAGRSIGARRSTDDLRQNSKEEEEEGQERVDKFSRQRDFAFKLLWDILKSKKKVFELQENSEYPISYKRMATILGKQV